MRWRWSLINDQWSAVLFLTAYCGLAGAMAGSWWAGLPSFFVWYGFALLGRNTL